MEAGKHPTVDVNLLAFNSEETIAGAIECVLGQTWPNVNLTIIDNGSTDRTVEIASAYCNQGRAIELRQNRVNVGQVLNCQRAFWYGDAEFVMPKTADDLLAPDFIAVVMDTLGRHPSCAMCHAAGVVFFGDGDVRNVYPETHRIHATGSDLVARSTEVMTRYTSAPSFWGIYRRKAVNQLGQFRYRAGWDHAVLAELALYGEIRHVPELLFWRRDGGKDVHLLARGASEYDQRGLSADDELADLRWMTPAITTAYAHIETFAVARVEGSIRHELMHQAQRIFQNRWKPMMEREAGAFRQHFPGLLAEAQNRERIHALWTVRHLADVISSIETMLPDQDFVAERLELAGFGSAVAA
jgi:hypothetical protein